MLHRPPNLRMGREPDRQQNCQRRCSYAEEAHGPNLQRHRAIGQVGPRMIQCTDLLSEF